MDSHVSNLVCPNCGANTSNHQNCEYCGSILVRFSDKGIAINESKYGKKSEPIKGLEEELKKNLISQKVNPKSVVCTEVRVGEHRVYITNSDKRGGIEYYFLTERKDGMPLYADLVNIPVTSTARPSIDFSVLFISEIKVPTLCQFRKELNNALVNEKYREEAFLQQDIASLFQKSTIPIHSKASKMGFANVYTISFGEDTKGAADFISEYYRSILKIEDVSKDVSFSTTTNRAISSGYAAVYRKFTWWIVGIVVALYIFLMLFI